MKKLTSTQVYPLSEDTDQKGLVAGGGDFGAPLDPTLDPQDLMGEVAGRSGITQSHIPNQSRQKAFQTDQTATDPTNMLSTRSGRVKKRVAEMDGNDEDVLNDQDDLQIRQFRTHGDETLDDAASPQLLGEQSVSGDMADPESDDDMLENAHQMGLQMGADDDNPQELDMAGDVAAAERRRHGM
jgi:hypothetical protein